MSEDLGDIVNRYAALPDALPPGQGPGEDGDEGTGPTAEQLREMHEEEREDRCDRVAEAIGLRLLAEGAFEGWPMGQMRQKIRGAALRCVEALRKEGLL